MHSVVTQGKEVRFKYVRSCTGRSDRSEKIDEVTKIDQVGKKKGREHIR